MQQLTGLDEMFLSLDTGPTTGHVAGIAIFPPHAQPRDELEFVRARVRERLPYLPLLRWSLHQAPLGIDQRYWVESGEVDVERHVLELHLPQPGTHEQLLRAADSVMAQLLDRDRPMWSIHVITGLDNGGYAWLLKITHGLADGSALWTIFDQLSDTPVEMLAPVPNQHPRGGRIGLLGKGIARAAKTPAVAAGLAVDMGKWAGDQLRRDKLAALPNTLARMLPGELSKPVALVANKLRPVDDAEIASLFPSLMPPSSPFNRTVTANQSIATCDFAIADLRRAGKLVDGTINDAVLAITAGALRRYMAGHGGIPDRPLLVSAPVSWRTGKETERWANQVWMLFLPIPTHLSDPLARLRYARQSALTAKANWDRVPGHLLRRASALMPSLILGPSVKVMARLPGRLTPKMYNVAVSNVKGPREIPVHGGAQMERYIVYGFLPPGCGLLLGGQSLGDRMVISATTCVDLVPDYQQLPALMQESLAELLALGD